MPTLVSNDHRIIEIYLIILYISRTKKKTPIIKRKHPIQGVERKADFSIVNPKENVYTQEVKRGRS